MNTPHAAIAVITFLIVYVGIVSEKINRAVLSLAGAVIVILFGVLSQEEAIKGISFNTIGFLVGMMIIVGITRRSGLFEYIAIKAAKISKGDPLILLALLTLSTGVLSALLDNVTTVLLVVPVTLSLADRLDLNPMPYLMAQIIGSNIGGTATLIGDPPNILIGSATGLGFNDFLFNLGPVVMVILPVTIAIMALFYRRDLTANGHDRARVMDLDEMAAIKDYKILKKSMAVMALIITGFLFHQLLHIESATIALGGAVLLMLVTKEEPEDILLAVEWPTLFFFIGLFILVESLVKVGVIEFIAVESLRLTQGNTAMTAMLVLWLSAIASAVVDNIPFVTAMIPLIKSIGHLTGMPLDPLWWSLALGACLGGNGTLVGASANVVVAGISEKHGYPISFKQFLKIGCPLMILSILISSLYIYLRYLM